MQELKENNTEASKKNRRIAGIIFGVWLSLIYSVVSHQINHIYMPGIPLQNPNENLATYYFLAVLVGVVFGLGSTWPENRWAGIFLGSALGGLMEFIDLWGNTIFSTAARTIGSLFFTVLTFLPVVVLLLPLSIIIRFSVDSLGNRQEKRFSIRRIGLPLLGTVSAIILGSFALYPAEARNAFYSTQELISTGQKSSSQSTLPFSLKSVEGFMEQGKGSYFMEYSDDISQLTGGVPATASALRSFLIMVHFDNGFSLACVYTGTSNSSTCSNFP